MLITNILNINIFGHYVKEYKIRKLNAKKSTKYHIIK